MRWNGSNKILSKTMLLSNKVIDDCRLTNDITLKNDFSAYVGQTVEICFPR